MEWKLPFLLLLTAEGLVGADQVAGLAAACCQDGEADVGDSSSVLLGSGGIWCLSSDGEFDFSFCLVLQGFLLRADFITKLRTFLSGFALTPLAPVESMNMNCCLGGLRVLLPGLESC